MRNNDPQILHSVEIHFTLTSPNNKAVKTWTWTDEDWMDLAAFRARVAPLVSEMVEQGGFFIGVTPGNMVAMMQPGMLGHLDIVRVSKRIPLENLVCYLNWMLCDLVPSEVGQRYEQVMADSELYETMPVHDEA